jgi:hypothetical protein
MSISRTLPRVLALAGALVSAAPSVVGFLALSAAVTPAHAQAACEFVPSNTGDPGGFAWSCPGPGNNPTSPNHFAAIAVSNSTTSWGDSWAQPTRASAVSAALNACRQHATDCKVQAWGEFRCLALAEGSDRSWGVDIGAYPETASAKALKQCRDAGGVQCRVVTHPCSED